MAQQAPGLTEQELIRQLKLNYNYVSDGNGRLYKLLGFTPMCHLPGVMREVA